MLHKFIFITMLALLIFSCKEEEVAAPAAKSESQGSWAMVKNIEESIELPRFKSKTFSINDFGAVANDDEDDSSAITEAIIACNQAGGGKVNIPSGVYLTGPVHLLDNVNLHLEEGAELKFSKNTADYLPLVHTSFEGNELMNYSPLIYAKNKSNIAVTGKGTLNGQAGNDAWWPWCGKNSYGYKDGEPHQRQETNRPRLVKLAQDDVPVEERIFGEGHYLRPPFL